MEAVLTRSKIITEDAPAKLNLFLHVTGRLPNGYHTLESLVVFASIADHITIEEHHCSTLAIQGPFADALRDCPIQDNLVTKTYSYFKQHIDPTLSVKITLEKNLPIQAGIGSGSSDAAATFRALEHYTGCSNTLDMRQATQRLGADFPVCSYKRPAYITGIGDKLKPLISFPKFYAVLVNPMKPLLTKDLFQKLSARHFQPSISSLPVLSSQEHWLEFLSTKHNSFEPTAMAMIPELKSILEGLKAQKGCMLARMSGSGPTCFGLFKTIDEAQQASKALHDNEPNFWIKPVALF